MNPLAFTLALLFAAVTVAHHPINGLNLLSLLLFAVVVGFSREVQAAPWGCEDCQGVQPCPVCHPSVERAS